VKKALRAFFTLHLPEGERHRREQAIGLEIRYNFKDTEEKTT
jgi:hypothetical protein